MVSHGGVTVTAQRRSRFGSPLLPNQAVFVQLLCHDGRYLELHFPGVASLRYVRPSDSREASEIEELADVEVPHSLRGYEVRWAGPWTVRARTPTAKTPGHHV